jgi:iron complex transport system ATP-binding protein
VTAAIPALRASGITAGYGSREVLREVSIEVAPGELLAIVGPNGAGKSTLLRVMAGTLTPWAGSVELFGRPQPTYDRRSLARTIASVPQENTVAFGFTVLEVVLMGRAPHLGAFHLETASDLEVARDALASFGILRLAGRRIDELSGGERKCVFLARAMAQQPRIALLDEPIAFLDLRHVREICSLFAHWSKARSVAVIASLHDLNVAALYADRVIMLKDGAVVACGKPVEVLDAATISAVYETDVYVGTNPATGTVAVLPGG